MAELLFPEFETPVKLPRDPVPGAEDLKLAEDERPQSWADLEVHARRVLALSNETGRGATRWVLFSGGNDSLVLLHFLVVSLGVEVDGVLHVNTGTGVIDDDGRQVTTEFARETVEGWGLPFVERHPPESYEELFIEQGIIDGLPGPGLHGIAYQRLKERAVAAFVQDTKRHYWDRVELWTGVRWAESIKRMGYGERIVNRERAQVWANPIYYATNEQMAAYRAEHDLPRNPVAEHLHLSGECLCGSYAGPGELEQIRFFYPATARRIEGWEARCRELGRTYSRWGHRRTAVEMMAAAAAIEGQLSLDDLNGAGPLCQSCPSRLEEAG